MDLTKIHNFIVETGIGQWFRVWVIESVSELEFCKDLFPSFCKSRIIVMPPSLGCLEEEVGSELKHVNHHI